MRVLRIAQIVLLTASLSAPLRAQSIQAGSVKLKLGGRAQMQFSTTSVDEQELRAAGLSPGAIPATLFETRRVRLATELEYDEWIDGKIEAELAMGRLRLRDTYMNLGFAPAFQLRVGQFKKPFSLLQLTSSSTWPMIERGVRIRGLDDALALGDSLAGFPRVLSRLGASVLPGEEQELLEIQGYQSYDLGASVHGAAGSFGYHAGVFNGAGADRPDDNDAKSWSGRVTYRLATAVPVTFGAAASHREFRTSLGKSDGTAYEADIEIGAFRRAGLHLLAEVSSGTSLGDQGGDFFGAQAVAAYFVPLAGQRAEGLELAGRISHGDPSDLIDDDDALLLTPGVNLYFHGRNRLMLNWDFYLPGGERFAHENALRAQAQFYF
ncbi:MAG: porin [Gemmatimonadota bacterium]